MEKPLLSVIVPVYKVEEYLDECIRSIVSQTYENLELLLVDDGSPDRSGEICDAWAAKDSRVRVIHKENAGAGAARNAALDAAKGELIGFVDSDDYISPQMYEHLYSMLDETTDIAECGYVSVTEGGTSFPELSQKVSRYTPQEAMACHIADTCFRQLIWNKLYRRGVIGNIRFPEQTVIDDEFFTYQVLGNARRLKRTESICYAYRQQAGSVMHQKYSLKRISGLRAKQMRLRYLEEHMPELAADAKYELYFSCLFAMQSALRSMAPEERREAERAFHEIMENLEPLPPNAALTAKRKILRFMTRLSLKGTAALLNVLQDIHLLK